MLALPHQHHVPLLNAILLPSPEIVTMIPMHGFTLLLNEYIHIGSVRFTNIAHLHIFKALQVRSC